MNEKRPLTFTLFFLRLLSGFGGGVAGTLMAFVVYFLMASLVPVGETSSLSVFTIIMIAFVATLTANTSTAVMISFMDSDKYKRRKTTLTHVFIFNLILFLFTIPLYILATPLEAVNVIAAVHFLLSAFISAILMEVLAGYEYALFGLYSTGFGIFIALGIALVMLATGASDLVILFGAMPFTWFILQVVNGLAELIYGNFFRFYGVAALSADTDLGGDAEEAAAEKEAKEDEENEENGEDEK